jgi:hypothetical protein
MKSQSLKRVANELTTRLGYKVFRTTKTRPDRKQFRYGHQVDKLQQYKLYKAKGISSFEFTTEKQKVKEWLQQGHTVFGRTTLTGSNGKGIVIIEPGDEVPAALVYTKYKKKKREFRVHIFKNKVVGIVEKRKKLDWEGPSDSRVRNLANGYVFCQTVELTETLRKKIEETALKARAITKSDFVGVDMGYNQTNDDVFVIETNSAPGIEGTNVQHYCDAIQQVL